jgi:hypothetical protein
MTKRQRVISHVQGLYRLLRAMENPPSEGYTCYRYIHWSGEWMFRNPNEIRKKISQLIRSLE